MLAWVKQWCDRTPNEQVHFFIHDLGLHPAAWYLNAELHQRTHHWENLRDEFLQTFRVEDGTGALDAALQNTNTLIEGRSRLYIAAGSRGMLVPHTVEYWSLSPIEGKTDPRTVPTMTRDEMRTMDKLLE